MTEKEARAYLKKSAKIAPLVFSEAGRSVVTKDITPWYSHILNLLRKRKYAKTQIAATEPGGAGAVSIMETRGIMSPKTQVPHAHAVMREMTKDPEIRKILKDLDKL